MTSLTSDLIKSISEMAIRIGCTFVPDRNKTRAFNRATTVMVHNFYRDKMKG